MTGPVEEGERALGQRRWGEALEYAGRALARDPDDARALVLAAHAERAAGRPDRAAGHLERAARLRPDDAQTWFTLGNVLHQAHRRHEARGAYERALALAPGSGPTHAALAKLCEELNDLGAARMHGDRALELAPDAPSALLVGALIDRREGRLPEARARFERLVTGDPAPFRQLEPGTRATVWNRYADVLDRLGEHGGAFEAYTKAQRIRWSLPDAQRVDPRAPLALLGAAEGLMRDDLLDVWAGFEPGDGVNDPAFLVGFPRSGTTLTEQILGAHPGVVTLDEDTPLADAIGALGAPYPAALAGLSDQRVRALRGVYHAGAARRLAEPVGGRTLVDKLPLTIMHLPLVCRLFPRARLIVAVRDPRDVCVSCLTQVMVPNDAMAHLRSIPEAADFLVAVMGFWTRVRGRVRLSWRESRYEDLVADPERGARGLLEHLGLPWDPAVLGFHEGACGKEISTPSYEAVARPVHGEAAGRWVRFADRFEGRLAALEPVMRELGYAP